MIKNYFFINGIISTGDSCESPVIVFYISYLQENLATHTYDE